MECAGGRLDLDRVEEVRQVLFAQVESSQDAEHPRRLQLLLAFGRAVAVLRVGTAPELHDLVVGRVGLQLVGLVFENLVKFARTQCHFIQLYYFAHLCLHRSLLLDELYHQMEDVGVYVAAELLLPRFRSPFARLRKLLIRFSPSFRYLRPSATLFPLRRRGLRGIGAIRDRVGVILEGMREEKLVRGSRVELLRRELGKG